MKDPYNSLGVTRNSTDDEIHQAYLGKVQIFTPDHNPEQFQEIRRAYDSIRTQRLRLQHDLFNSEPPELSELLEMALASAKPRRPNEKLIRRLISATGVASVSQRRKNRT